MWVQFNNTITDECAIRNKASVHLKVFQMIPTWISNYYLHICALCVCVCVCGRACVCVNVNINNTRLSHTNCILSFYNVSIHGMKHLRTKKNEESNDRKAKTSRFKRPHEITREKIKRKLAEKNIRPDLISMFYYEHFYVVVSFIRIEFDRK